MVNPKKDYKEYMEFVTKEIINTFGITEEELNKKIKPLKITVSKKRYPKLLTRIKWKIFSNSMKLGWKWYHSIVPNKILKKFNLHFVPWTYNIDVDYVNGIVTQGFLSHKNRRLSIFSKEILKKINDLKRNE